jgi:hypothetical protein
MRHPSCRQLYDYWNEQRGLRAAPENPRIEPGAIRHVLADTFTLDVDLHAGHRFHFVGTRVDAAFGRELKTQSFVNLWRTEYRDLVRNILAVVTDESLGVVASASAKSSEGIPLEFELLILPLKQRGRTDNRVMGALVPRSMPDWFGVRAVGPMALGPHRYLGHHNIAAPVPSLAKTLSAGHLINGFVVYEGGRS